MPGRSINTALPDSIENAGEEKFLVKEKYSGKISAISLFVIIIEIIVVVFVVVIILILVVGLLV